MLNLYESIRSNLHLNKFEIGDLLFAEYTCPLAEDRVGVWTDSDYFVHVISGKKTWHTVDATWVAEAGQTLFFKKGAAVVEQHFQADFCVILIFVPDGFVRETVRELSPTLPSAGFGLIPTTSAIRVVEDVPLSAFFQSMLTYFSGKQQPHEALLRLKLKELIASVLSGQSNPALAGYFHSLIEREGPSVREIMENNYRYNLSLEEFARMCHRSLSSFKRDFEKHFKESPGKWLLRKRLDHAAVLLRHSEKTVTELAFELGFEDVSHFSRAFKARFELNPSAFRASPATTKSG